MSDRKLIGQVTITETTETTFDVFEGDWDFDVAESEPSDEDMAYVIQSRKPRMTIDDMTMEFEREDDDDEDEEDDE